MVLVSNKKISSVPLWEGIESEEAEGNTLFTAEAVNSMLRTVRDNAKDIIQDQDREIRYLQDKVYELEKMVHPPKTLESVIVLKNCEKITVTYDNDKSQKGNVLFFLDGLLVLRVKEDEIIAIQTKGIN